MRVSLIQLTVEDDIKFNLVKIKELLFNALKSKPDFILLPECFLFLSDSKKKIYENIISTKSDIIKFFINFSKKFNVFLLLGSIPIIENNLIYNYSLLLDNNGKIISTYKKIHMFDVTLKNGEEYKESDTYTAGNQLNIFRGSNFILGHSICYDLRFPKLFRALANNGAEIVVCPSAFTSTTGKDHWHVLVRARAIENGVFMLAPNQWGINKNKRSTYGHSLVVDPWGKVIIDGGEGEKVVNCEIDLSEIKKARKSIPILMHDRNFENQGSDEFSIVIK